MRFSGLIFFSVLLFLSSGCEKEDQPELLSKGQLEVFAYLPRQSEFLLYMNLNQLRHTDLWDNYFKKSLDSYQEQKWLSEFESATSIGINDGVAEVYLATSWAGTNIFIIRFDKNYDKIKNYFDTSYSTYLSNNNKIYFKENNPSSEYYLTDKSLLLIANNREFITSITTDGFNSIKENAGMMSAINSIRKKKYYWMATDKGNYASALIDQLVDLRGSEDEKKMFSSIKGISLSASFEDGAEFASLWELSNERDAFLFSVALRSAISNNAPKNIDDRLKEIINKIKVKRNDNAVSIDLSLDKNDLTEIQNISNKKNMNKKL